MPELPEVETVRRTLEPSLLGRRVSRVRVGLAKMVRPGPRSFARGLGRRRIDKVSRHGKLLILHLSQGAFWAVHLGMTGQLIVAPQRPQVPHIHVTVSFSGQGDKLYFRDLRQFGRMTFCTDHEALRQGPLANFGPDALLIGSRGFAAALEQRRAPLKSLLLDQRLLAGVGNIYADEALHRAGINPLARPVDLAEADLVRLYACLRETLAEALAKGGSSVRNFVDAHGRAGTFQHAHRVYRRTGQPCPVCAGPVERVVLAGRSTHFCPNCQPRAKPLKPPGK